MNQRDISRNILVKVIKEGAYANLLMRTELNDLPLVKRGFCTEIVNGVLRNYHLLKYQYQDYLKGKIDVENEVLLNMAMYERFFMGEKDYAVNNEYVQLCKDGHQKGFINAILRKAMDYKMPEEDDKNCTSIVNSIPSWICGLLKKQYSGEDFNRILESFKQKSNVVYRLNLKQCKREDLKLDGLTWLNDKCFISKDNLINSIEYKIGFFYIQDFNSSMLSDQLELKPDSLFLDMCSAPGSKLFNALDIVEADNAYCNDLYPQRVDLIKKKAKVLKHDGIHYFVGDAREIPEKTDVHFTHILLDAPCSGLGVIGRRPDLKFHITPESLDELQVLQKDLLDSAYKLLADGGVLVYSTCTLNTKENHKQVASFLERYADIKMIREETIINKSGDCFYYARLVKNSIISI